MAKKTPPRQAVQIPTDGVFLDHEDGTVVFHPADYGDFLDAWDASAFDEKKLFADWICERNPNCCGLIFCPGEDDDETVWPIWLIIGRDHLRALARFFSETPATKAARYWAGEGRFLRSAELLVAAGERADRLTSGARLAVGLCREGHTLDIGALKGECPDLGPAFFERLAGAVTAAHGAWLASQTPPATGPEAPRKPDLKTI